MKKVEIIPIAKRKVARRNIPENWIIETVNSPMEVMAGYGGRQVAHRKYIIDDKEYLLRVIFEKREEGKLWIGTMAEIANYIKEEKTNEIFNYRWSNL